MFLPNLPASLDALAKEYDLSTADIMLLKNYLALNSEEREAVVDFAVRLVNDLQKLTTPITRAQKTGLLLESLGKHSLNEN